MRETLDRWRNRRSRRGADFRFKRRNTVVEGRKLSRIVNGGGGCLQSGNLGLKSGKLLKNGHNDVFLKIDAGKDEVEKATHFKRPQG